MTAARTGRGWRAGAVLLDLDGTLIDSEPMNRQMYDLFFADRGWSVDRATYARFIGRRAVDVFATAPGPWADEDPQALYEEVLAYLPRITARPLALAGATAALRGLAGAGVPTAIVTSATPAWVAIALREVLADDSGAPEVDVTVTADDVRHGKPDPEGYLLACRRLGVAASAALAVEDAPAGVAAARAAGAGFVLGLATTHTGTELHAAGADQVLPALPGAEALLSPGSLAGRRA